MPVLTTLPAPTWAQSENNLLPKWLKYLEWHNRTYSADELTNARRLLTSCRGEIEAFLKAIADQKRAITEAKMRRQECLDAEIVSDDMIMAQYEQLIASPHVVGTAIGMFGELRVLIDPQLDGHEHIEFGVFELSCRSSGRSLSVYQVKFYDETYYPLASHLRGERVNFGGSNLMRFDIESTNDFNDRLRSYNLRSLVDNFVEYVIRRHVDRFRSTKPADRSLDWSGYNVLDPVSAMKIFLKKCRVKTSADQAAELSSKIQRYEMNIREYNDTLRSYRKQVRKLESQIAKLEAALNTGDPDTNERIVMLHKITTMPGVIGIRFVGNGIPVLHVRSSFVHQGKRYDLGDYELFFETARVYNGAMRVRRTRMPAGGDYTAGWHPDGFCFGNRAEAIRTAFLQGDFVHAVNVAIGSLNTISEGDFNGYMFAEIPLNMVWNRQIRRRPRRRSVTRAMGATALLAATG